MNAENYSFEKLIERFSQSMKGTNILEEIYFLK